MAQENEDNEIDQYLANKIDDAINLLGEPKHLVAKSYSFKTEFTNVLKDLRKPTNPKLEDTWASVRRGNLYSLNNLVTEWKQITKNQTSLSAKEVYEACENIKKSLRKMKKDASGDQESSSRGDPDGSHSRRSSLHDQELKYPSFKRNTEEVHRWSSRHEPRKVHGVDHRVLTMVRELVLRKTDAPFKVFGVVGAAGIGKTTLCQKIFNHNLVKDHFSPRIWVCLSKQSKDRTDFREEIVVRMLKRLGIEDEIIGDAAAVGLKRLILLLRLQLIGKRYLIVLDDAWNEDEFFYNLTQKDQLDQNWGEELAYGLPKGSGGTVISSSTSDPLLKKMLGEDVSLKQLEPLNREIIYEIFKDAVIGYDDDVREYHKDLDLIKEELIDRCDGIPLTAKLLAEIAWKNLDIKPKREQMPTGAGGSGHGVGHAPAGGHARIVGGDDGDRVPEIGKK